MRHLQDHTAWKMYGSVGDGRDHVPARQPDIPANDICVDWIDTATGALKVLEEGLIVDSVYLHRVGEVVGDTHDQLRVRTRVRQSGIRLEGAVGAHAGLGSVTQTMPFGLPKPEPRPIPELSEDGGGAKALRAAHVGVSFG